MSGLPTQMGSALGNETGNFTLHSAAGISMVKGVRITRTSENDANRTVTITLSSNASSGNTPAVTVEARRMSFDLMYLLQQYQMMSGLMAKEGVLTNSSSAFMPGELGNFSGNMMMTSQSQNNTLDGEREPASLFNITALFQSMENGSSILQQGWTSPQQVSITLESNKTSSGSLSPSAASSTVLGIAVIPFTGGQNMTATSSSTTTPSPNNTTAMSG
jgi:hypothetical protein